MSDILDFLVVLLSGTFGIVLVVTLLFWLWLRNFNKRLEAELTRMINEAENRTIPLEIEIDNGHYYCYNAVNKQFVCQGATAQDVRDAFRARYPIQGAWLAGNMNDPKIQELVSALMELKNVNT